LSGWLSWREGRGEILVASPGDQREVEVSIIRWVDDEPQPGIIEFVLSDRSGRQWYFHEKCAVISGEFLEAASVYPKPGTLRCTVLSQGCDPAGRSIVEIDTHRPWFVESLEGTSRFEVISSQLLPES